MDKVIEVFDKGIISTTLNFISVVMLNMIDHHLENVYQILEKKKIGYLKSMKNMM